MPLQVDAVYENGVLRPLQPLDLQEHEHVVMSVVKTTAPERSSLAVEYIEKIKKGSSTTRRPAQRSSIKLSTLPAIRSEFPA